MAMCEPSNAWLVRVEINRPTCVETYKQRSRGMRSRRALAVRLCGNKGVQASFLLVTPEPRPACSQNTSNGPKVGSKCCARIRGIEDAS